MERKIDCKRYSECLDKAAKKNKPFNCTKCMSYEKPSQTRVDEFEEELMRPTTADGRPPQEGEMTARGRGSNQGKTCDVTGCIKPAYCQGKCVMHYARLKRGQAVDGPARKPGRQPKQAATSTDNEKPVVRATKKTRGAYLPKGPKLEQAVEMLIQCGFLKREKLAAAMELVRE